MGAESINPNIWQPKIKPQALTGPYRPENWGCNQSNLSSVPEDYSQGRHPLKSKRGQTGVFMWNVLIKIVWCSRKTHLLSVGHLSSLLTPSPHPWVWRFLALCCAFQRWRALTSQDQMGATEVRPAFRVPTLQGSATPWRTWTHRCALEWVTQQEQQTALNPESVHRTVLMCQEEKQVCVERVERYHPACTLQGLTIYAVAVELKC